MDGKNIAAALGIAIIVMLFPLIIAIVAISQDVSSEDIVDGSISESDLEETLQVKFQLPDGQVFDANIFTNQDAEIEGLQDGDVLGLSTEDGRWRVVYDEESNSLVVEPQEASITGEYIEDDTITVEDITPNIISSINGQGIDGGNVDIVSGDNIEISSGFGNISISVDDGSGSNLDADTFDGNDSEFFTNASNINQGSLSSDFFSAYDDLSSEGYLDFSNGVDIVTKTQADGEYVNVTGDSMSGDLNINAELSVNGTSNLMSTNVMGTLTIVGDTVQVGNYDHTGNMTQTGDLSRTGGSYLNGELYQSGGDILIGDYNYSTSIAGGDLILDPGLSNIDSNFDFSTVNYGNFKPFFTETFDIGGMSYRWRNIYAEDLFADCFNSIGGSTYCDDAYIVGDLEIDGDIDGGVLSINNLASNGPESTNATSALTYDVPTFESTLVGDSNIQGSLIIDEDLILSGGFSEFVASGDARIGDDLDVNDELRTNIIEELNSGGIDIRTNTAVFNSQGNFVIDDNAQITGMLTVDGMLDASDIEADAISTTGDIEVGGVLDTNEIDSTGGLLIDGGDVTINAQLNVNDLEVTNTTNLQGTLALNDNVLAGSTNIDIGTNTNRIDTIFSNELDISNQLTIADNGTIMVGDGTTSTLNLEVGSLSLSNGTTTIADVQSTIESNTTDIANNSTAIVGIDGRLTTVETDITALDTRVTANETDIANLQARSEVIGGLESSSQVATNTSPAVYTITAPAGRTFNAITVTPISSGENVKEQLIAFTPGDSTVTVNVYGPGSGTATIDGVSYTAILTP